MPKSPSHTLETFALAPALPPRKVAWRRAWRLLRALFKDPAKTELAFALFEAVGGQGDECTVQAFASHAEGRRLFVDRPALLPLLADREALAALPPESFGRAYLTFASRNGFEADGLLEANERGLSRINAQLDGDRIWFFERVNLMHDLWHVLTGYETDSAGEVALLAFSSGQGLASRAVRLLLLASLATSPKGGGFGFQRFVLQARRRGRAAGPLFVQRYEELLPLPLTEVRRMLGIQPVEDAHPGGMWIGDTPQHATRVAS